MFFLAFDEVFQLFGPEWGARRNCGHPVRCVKWSRPWQNSTSSACRSRQRPVSSGGCAQLRRLGPHVVSLGAGLFADVGFALAGRPRFLVNSLRSTKLLRYATNPQPVRVEIGAIKLLGTMGRTLRLLGLGLSLCLTTLATTAAGLPKPALDFPVPVDSYHDQQIPSLFGKLTSRIQREPLNLVATIIFFGAIVHTFLAGWFRKIAHNYQQSYDAIEYLLEAKDGPPDFGKRHDKLLFRAQLLFHGRSRSGFRYLVNSAFRCDYCVPRVGNDG
jgi:hypothetical protein